MPQTSLNGYSNISSSCRLSAGSPSAGATREALLGRLQTILQSVLAARIAGGGQQAIASDANWVDLGINSVDFLSFVLTVEKEFGIEVPEETLAEGTLMSLDAWTDHLLGRLAETPRTTDGGA